MNVLSDQDLVMKVDSVRFKNPGSVVLVKTSSDEFSVLGDGMQVVELVPADKLDKFIKQILCVQRSRVCVIEQC